ncbi:hypothetical protein BH747_09955 [Enterococcus villorum]|uniref:Uncharacterized protein n=1 Tax=Enterococcus villorum TaxID=112904 RepID=A0A1V8YJ81_9ENTE|nr:hypothetical protein [Enterococcus villorum]OQO69584.1 hypothetical protein BH747_09955 [Enterococcus villorum]OQO72664.1 hypothetical protein BH744_11145 [Enterococcus villorum]
MKAEDKKIQEILSLYKEGLNLDGILIQLERELTNENRLLLTSKLQWNRGIIRTYQERTKQVCTIYKLKQFSS